MMIEWLAAHAREAVQQNGGKGQAETVERVLAGSFALRGLVPLLLARSFTSSRGFLSIYVNRVTTKHPSILLPGQPNPKPYTPPGGVAPGAEVQQMYSTASPDLNFAQMAFALVSQAVDHKKRTRGQKVPDSLRDSWITLVRQFERESQDEEDEFFFEVSTESETSSSRYSPTPLTGYATIIADLLRYAAAKRAGRQFYARHARVADGRWSRRSGCL
jgi:hypothetical protein